MSLIWTLTGQLSQGGRPRTIPLQATPFRVGRRTDLSLCLSRQAVSSLHAEFTLDGEALFLRDLQSTNGTYVNGDRIKGQVEVYRDDLVQFADMPFRLGRQPSDMNSRTLHEDVGDQALGLVHFDQLIHDHGLLSHFQPIVDLRTLQTVAYEILSRSGLAGLENPGAMFDVAMQLDREIELSRVMRVEGIRTSALFPEPPHVFINTHPLELADDGLLESIAELRRLALSQPITIEIHEAAVGDVSRMKELRAGLHDLDMRLAFDDFGAGQARLFELGEVRPHYLKFDRQMVKDIDQASAPRQQMVAHLVQLVAELGVVPLAEGIEREAEGDVCREMGFELVQGFYYGRPAAVSAHLETATSASGTPFSPG